MVLLLVVLTFLFLPYLLHSMFQSACICIWENLCARWPSSLDCYIEAKAWKDGYEEWAPSMQ